MQPTLRTVAPLPQPSPRIPINLVPRQRVLVLAGRTANPPAILLLPLDLPLMVQRVPLQPVRRLMHQILQVLRPLHLRAGPQLVAAHPALAINNLTLLTFVSLLTAY